MRIIVDKDKCTGCRICELTCSAFHNRSINIYRSRIRLKTNEILPKVPRTCIHCEEPKCLESCNFDALYLDSNNIVRVNNDNCVKCYLCIKACPYDLMFLDSVTEYPIKCDLCDGNPRCIKQCPENALSLG